MEVTRVMELFYTSDGKLNKASRSDLLSPKQNTPVDQKGEPVKAEVCGAVFAARLRRYIEKHSRIQVERLLHLLDSQTGLGAIQRDSYGHQNFFANRVEEIQKSTSVDDWRWIPGEQNIADLITRGGTPEHLAWVWRAATKWRKVLAGTLATNKPKWEGISSTQNVKSKVREATLTVRV